MFLLGPPELCFSLLVGGDGDGLDFNNKISIKYENKDLGGTRALASLSQVAGVLVKTNEAS